MTAALGSINSQTNIYTASEADSQFAPISTTVVGPVSSTDNNAVRFDGITGKLVQNSDITISDTGDINLNSGNVVFPTTNISRIIKVNPSANDVAGLSITINSGTGGDSSTAEGKDGGELIIRSGQGGTTTNGAFNGGLGGALTLSGGIAGDGNASNATPGTGGAVEISGGIGGNSVDQGGGAGGDVTVRGGYGQSHNTAFGFAGVGGFVNIFGGSGGQGNVTDASGNIGGNVNIYGGAGGAGSTGAAGGNGGDIILLGGDAASPGNSTGGDIFIAGGDAVGSGADGDVCLAVLETGTARGKVGIGTISPTAQLHITGAGTSKSAIRIVAASAPSSPNAGDLWHDSTQKKITVYTNTVKETLLTSLFTQTADKSVTNTVTETSILGTGVGTLTLPANFFVAGKTIEILVSGVYSTVGVSGDIVTFKVKYGSTVLATKATTGLVTGGTNLYWWGRVLITCRTTGSSGTVMTSGDVTYQIAGNATLMDELNNGAATTTINTTTSNAIDVTVTHSAANASNTIKSIVSAIKIIN